MPAAGDTLVTTLDVDVQAAAEEALRTGISLAHADGKVAANGGAAVVLDVRNGDILGMASYPTYDPDVWVGGISTKDYKRLIDKQANNPMLVRPIMEAKAVGSTFKAVTAVAGLEEGVIASGTTQWCPGWYSSPNDQADPPQKFNCWAHDGHGTLDLIGAITQSCDVYFYNVGNAFYNRKGEALEDWAKRLGMGKATGIDIPGESAGRVPTPGWKKQHYETEIDKIWKPGDSILLSVGQGDLEATPLQLAVSYAAVANGGKVVTPHLGLKVVDSAGQTVRDLQPPSSRNVDISQSTLDVVRRGLYEASHGPAGTSAPIFYNYKVGVAGKTGTAEVWDDTSKHYVDYAWYASYAPADDPKYAVVVMIEKGGHGATAAAPATRVIYDALFDIDSGEFTGTVQGD
jgi:penicillin-binding protein 2